MGYKVLLETLSPKLLDGKGTLLNAIFTFVSLRGGCIKNTPLVIMTQFMKRNIYNPLASRSFGESVSKSTLYPIFTFSHIMHC